MKQTIIFKENSFINFGHEFKIGDNVFIGGRSIILGDVTIGNNVIIGAGTIVTKDIPDGVVAVGSPARVVGSFDDLIARYIQDNQNKE